MKVNKTFRLDGISSLNYTDDHDHKGQDKEKVNIPSEGIRTNHAESPEYQQNNKDGP